MTIRNTSLSVIHSPLLLPTKLAPPFPPTDPIVPESRLLATAPRTGHGELRRRAVHVFPVDVFGAGGECVAVCAADVFVFEAADFETWEC